MSALFEAITINGMTLANRFVRSATWEGLADHDGAVTGKLIQYLVELAKNEVGLIISGYTFVSPEGQSSSLQLAACHDRFVPGLRDMAQAVHEANGKIALQLVHAGKFSNRELTGQIPMGPSDEENDGIPSCRAMSEGDILAAVLAFTRAAVRAKDAGIDAIQLHAAHGFLLSQFLCPAFNKRSDAYGGTLKNRARFLLEVVHSIRQAVGTGYPILVKLNSEDFLENGMTREEAAEVASWLATASVDAVELSGGTVASQELIPPRPGMLKTRESEVYYRESAQLYWQKVVAPLMLVGGIRSLEVAEELIDSGLADFVSMSRPLIGEPDLIKRWHAGDRRKAECLSCNGCFGPAIEGKGLYCVALNQGKL